MKLFWDSKWFDVLEGNSAQHKNIQNFFFVELVMKWSMNVWAQERNKYHMIEVKREIGLKESFPWEKCQTACWFSHKNLPIFDKFVFLNNTNKNKTYDDAFPFDKFMFRFRFWITDIAALIEFTLLIEGETLPSFRGFPAVVCLC